MRNVALISLLVLVAQALAAHPSVHSQEPAQERHILQIIAGILAPWLPKPPHPPHPPPTDEWQPSSNSSEEVINGSEEPIEEDTDDEDESNDDVNDEWASDDDESNDNAELESRVNLASRAVNIAGNITNNQLTNIVAASS